MPESTKPDCNLKLITNNLEFIENEKHHFHLVSEPDTNMSSGVSMIFAYSKYAHWTDNRDDGKPNAYFNPDDESFRFVRVRSSYLMMDENAVDIYDKMMDTVSTACNIAKPDYNFPIIVKQGHDWILAQSDYLRIYGKDSWQAVDNKIAKSLYQLLISVPVHINAECRPLFAILAEILWHDLKSLIFPWTVNNEHGIVARIYKPWWDNLYAAYLAFSAASKDFFDISNTNSYSSINLEPYVKNAWLWFCYYMPELLAFYSQTQDA